MNFFTDSPIGYINLCFYCYHNSKFIITVIFEYNWHFNERVYLIVK